MMSIATEANLGYKSKVTDIFVKKSVNIDLSQTIVTMNWPRSKYSNAMVRFLNLKFDQLSPAQLTAHLRASSTGVVVPILTLAHTVSCYSWTSDL